MAFRVQRNVGWSYGTGTPPYKYEFACDLLCDMVSQTDTEAIFNITGTVSAILNQNTQYIPDAISDYAIINSSQFDPYNYPFQAGGDYLVKPLPYVPNAPSSFTDEVLIEFRGDIYQGQSVPHSVSLYIKGQGVVLPTTTAVGNHTFNVNLNFTLPLTGDKQQAVLIYNNSYVTGSGASMEYHWDLHQTWASMFDFDYRPGATWNGVAYMSHNRDGGVCSVWNGTKWAECRTEGYPDAKGNPPVLYRDNDYYNMAKFGEQA